MLDGKLEYGQEMTTVGEPTFMNDHEVTTTSSSSSSKNKKKSKNNKRRFSDEQIKSLESMFESETRLEPRKKLQVARELGLQPRQVAIWFQNKRARWKSKQLERDYTILQANYNTLASKFEALKKEKQALMIQLQKLNESVKKGKLEEGGQLGAGMNGDGAIEAGEGLKYCESEGQVSLSMERSSEHALGVLSDDDSGIKTDHYFGLEEEDQANNLVSMVEAGDDGCLTSPEDWRSFESDGLFDEPSSSAYQWWDFWS